MPYTVWGAFDQFRKNIVDLDPEVTKTARSSRDYLFEQLKKLSKDDVQFPRLAGGYLSFGSFARSTKIRPLDDIDLLLLLNGQGTSLVQSPQDPYNFWLRISDQAAPLCIFPDEHGYVNSTKVLNKIKSALASVASYGKAEIHKNMQAVTLDLVSYDWVFDIVPAVPVENNSGGTAYYLIPNGHGDWIRTDPRIDQDNITRLNTQHDKQFLPTVRLLKYWNQRTHKPILPSYYFETLALQVFDYASKITDFPTAVKYFSDFCPTYLMSACPDPKNLGPALDASVDSDTKQKVAQAMKEASEYAGYALMYEGQSNEEKAIYWWCRIFGTEYPDYGS